MAQAYPEGEVFFRRSVLPFITDESSFYGNFLVEHVWNDYPALCRPNDRDEFIRNTTFGGRAVAQQRHWDAWGESFWDFTWVTIMHSSTRSGYENGDVKSGYGFGTNWDWKEYTNVVWNGAKSYKVRFQQMPMGDQPYILIDLAVPIRALYFPVAFQADEAYPDHCTYLMVDFTNRDGNSAIRIPPDPAWGSEVTINCDKSSGIHIRQDFTSFASTMGIDVRSLYLYLSLPRQLRNPARGILKADEAGKEIIYLMTADYVRFTKDQVAGTVGWSKDIDYAEVLSGNTGLSLCWQPYQHSNWLLSFLQNAVSFGLGMIPIAGPFLEVGFTVAVKAITDPDAFAGDNILDLGKDIIDAVIDSAGNAKEFMVPGVDIDFHPPPGGKGMPAEQRIKLLHERDAREGGLRPSLFFILRQPGRQTGKTDVPQQSEEPAKGGVVEEVKA